MNRKNIQNKIKRKIDDWCNSINDEELVKKIKQDVVVTGGCITSMLLNEDINDFDIYFKTKETTYEVAKYYIDKWKVKHKEDKDIHVFNAKEDYIKFVEKYYEVYYKGNEEKSLEEIYEEIGEYYDDRVTIYIPSKGVVGDFRDMSEFENFKSKSFENKIQQIEEKKNNKKKYVPVFMSSNAITLSDDIQIIIRFFGSPEEIHENFDFIHCQNYYVYSENKLFTSVESLEATLSKELIYHGSKYPLCSLIRLRKFIKRGWYINAGQILKIALNLQEFDLSDVNVLRDQLIGADSAYFLGIIFMIKRDLAENRIKQDDINYSYICELIDKVFN